MGIHLIGSMNFGVHSTPTLDKTTYPKSWERLPSGWKMVDDSNPMFPAWPLDLISGEIKYTSMVVKTQKSGGMPKRLIHILSSIQFISTVNPEIRSFRWKRPPLSVGENMIKQISSRFKKAKLLSWQQIKQPEPGQLGAKLSKSGCSRIEFLLKLATVDSKSIQVKSWFRGLSMVHICKCIYCIYI